MREEVEFSVKKFRKAFSRLQEGVPQAKTDLVGRRRSAFLLHLNCFGRLLKVTLEDKGVFATTPKDRLQAAFRLRISDDVVFLEMLEARNKMSHQYDEAEGQKVFKQIKKRFLKTDQRSSHPTR